ncbi:MAG: cytochrome b [Alphaproteobacteria bacterium]|nr:cytochrome b [Alphaproteobacteria bacterium]
MKSTNATFGTVAKSLHWLSALFIIGLLVSGFRSGFSNDVAAKAAILQFHIPIAILVLLLTTVRIVWWIFFDKKPAPAGSSPAWQETASRWTHRTLYLLIILMLGSGITLSLISGAPDAVFGTAPLPEFQDYTPRIAHGILARVLVAIVLLHVGAALFHHFFQKDDTLRRMWFSKKTNT